jgi:hypothetical protein
MTKKQAAEILSTYLAAFDVWMDTLSTHTPAKTMTEAIILQGVQDQQEELRTACRVAILALKRG